MELFFSGQRRDIRATGRSDVPVDMETRRKPGQDSFTVQRAQAEDIDTAWRIVAEYYEAANVLARDSRECFAQVYFEDGAGVWLARIGEDIVGCVALRKIAAHPECGEIKRLYVRPPHRGCGVAAALYEALETYARRYGYGFLCLDTTDEMVAAQKFYAAEGYEPTPRYNENRQATIFMRKDLRQTLQ